MKKLFYGIALLMLLFTAISCSMPPENEEPIFAKIEKEKPI